ncbi:hypothetical protein HMI55_000140 [Coelomomyces lativittatus]|nr:hypothetical protein HMI55_000140 [Coelomomyces lativittatus]
MPSAYLERISTFQKVLSPPNGCIQFEQFRQLCFHGIPDVKDFRPTCWKILLNYLPSETKDWNFILKRKRNTYKQFVLDFCTEQVSEDQPLTSFHFRDLELMDLIIKDVRRTLSNLSFFQTQRSAISNFLIPTLNTLHETHYHVIERILYVYAQLNPGIGYIQGMTYFVFPVYYLLASCMAIDDEQAMYAEADTFFMFHEIVTDYRDFFMHSMDKDLSSGLTSAYRDLVHRLHKRDPELSNYLIQLDMQPEYYALRWCTCLCAQELELPWILRLWDTLFSDRISARKRAMREHPGLLVPLQNEFFTEYLVSHLTELRSRILHQPFDSVLQCLQMKPWENTEKTLEITFLHLSLSHSPIENKITQFLKKWPSIKRRST